MLDKVAFLYVEDDPLSRDVMEMLMEYVVGPKNLVMFEDSTDFMARLKQLTPRPDVILLDIYVQPEDGFAMLEALRHDPDFQHVKVIALTASVMEDEIERLRRHGFDGVIGKPLDSTTFPDLLERIIKGEAVWRIL
jgi:CheY-like chemotaxis protein